MLKQSARILQKRREQDDDRSVGYDFDSISKNGYSRHDLNSGRKRGASVENDDLDDVFKFNDIDFNNMGYVESMKISEMQRLDL